MKVFLTGGAGFIGSHTALELLSKNHEICIYDNFHNSDEKTIENLKLIANKKIMVARGDIRNATALNEAFKNFKPDSIIHFAGLKAVGDSLVSPLEYYDVNLSGTRNLLEVANKWNCSKIVFSSSATVYGNSDILPYTESHEVSPINPYGKTKLYAEELIRDWVLSSKGKKASILRYFNPVGAHKSGLIGEYTYGKPNNLMPYISQTAAGMRDSLSIFGSDYETRDGTGERDYIHVVELAQAHVTTIEMQEELDSYEIFNLGAGKGTTVLELVAAFEKISGVKINRKFVERRLGDAASSFASTDYAFKKLGIHFKKSIEEMCEDTWRFEVMKLRANK